MSLDKYYYKDEDDKYVFLKLVRDCEKSAVLRPLRKLYDSRRPDIECFFEYSKELKKFVPSEKEDVVRKVKPSDEFEYAEPFRAFKKESGLIYKGREIFVYSETQIYEE